MPWASRASEDRWKRAGSDRNTGARDYGMTGSLWKFKETGCWSATRQSRQCSFAHTV